MCGLEAKPLAGPPARAAMGAEAAAQSSTLSISLGLAFPCSLGRRTRGHWLAADGLANLYVAENEEPSQIDFWFKIENWQVNWQLRLHRNRTSMLGHPAGGRSVSRLCSGRAAASAALRSFSTATGNAAAAVGAPPRPRLPPRCYKTARCPRGRGPYSLSPAVAL